MSIVMEYCALGSLFHVMQSPTNSMGWDRVFHCAIETVKGINFLHSQNILHRDIKSLNILVTQSWCIKVITLTKIIISFLNFISFFFSKLCDFGVARLNNLNNLVTLRRMKTTPAWSAPVNKKKIILKKIIIIFLKRNC